MLDADTATLANAPTAIIDYTLQLDQSKKQSREAIKDILFGSIAGTCGKIIEYPFDTVKVRLQSQPVVGSSTSRPGIYYDGPLDCFRKSIAAGGVRGLYRGVSAPILGAAVETSSLFFSYRIAQEIVVAIAYPPESRKTLNLKTDLPFSALLLCGAASGAFTSLLLTPIELVKCQMQSGIGSGLQGVTTPSSPLSVIASIWKHSGFLGFWRGQLGTLIRETGGSAAWFGSYEGVSKLLAQRNIPDPSSTRFDSLGPAPTPLWHQLLAGACAGVAYNFVFYPADTIKSRMQTEQIDTGSSNGSKTAIGAGADAASRTSMNTGVIHTRPTFWTIGHKIWTEQGLFGLYRGCGITVARAAPSSAIIFAIFEYLRSNFA